MSGSSLIVTLNALRVRGAGAAREGVAAPPRPNYATVETAA